MKGGISAASQAVIGALAIYVPTIQMYNPNSKIITGNTAAGAATYRFAIGGPNTAVNVTLGNLGNSGISPTAPPAGLKGTVANGVGYFAELIGESGWSNKIFQLVGSGTAGQNFEISSKTLVTGN
jgi:hypothetical protein